MSDRWTNWKSFPDDFYGEFIQAPLGPGLYEVCRSSTREQVAFGCTRNVAEALGDLLRPRGLKSWLFFKRGRRYETGELEYRTWPTATLTDAKNVLGLIRERHEAVMRKYAASARV
jgi:predicted Fe-S protein YdhL (DUF1289 family)